MPKMKPGENPISDMFNYGKHPFPPDMELMIRKLRKVNGNLLSGVETESIEWEKGLQIASGKRKLRKLLLENGVTREEIDSLLSILSRDKKRIWIRNIAGLVGIAWAGWWIYFSFSSLNATDSNVRSDWTGLLTAGIFLISVFIAWKWEALGAILMILEGLFVTASYFDDTPREDWLTSSKFLVVGVPAVISGILFIISWTRMRKLLASDRESKK